jgi:hypothetical protein
MRPQHTSSTSKCHLTFRNYWPHQRTFFPTTQNTQVYGQNLFTRKSKRWLNSAAPALKIKLTTSLTFSMHYLKMKSKHATKDSWIWWPSACLQQLSRYPRSTQLEFQRLKHKLHQITSESTTWLTLLAYTNDTSKLSTRKLMTFQTNLLSCYE